MHTYKKIILTFFVLGSAISCTTSSIPQSPKLGQAMSPEELKKIDISVGPDGVGLPVGQATPSQEQKYIKQSVYLVMVKKDKVNQQMLLLEESAV